MDEGEKAVVRVGMSVRGLTLTHDRLGRNSIVIVGDRTVFGNTANSVGCKITKRTTSRCWDSGPVSSSTGLANSHGLWETGGMKKPQLTNVDWLGPRDEMDRASHRFGKCSECGEIVCVEKAVTDGPSTLGKTSEILDEAFRIHVRLKHSEDFNLTAIPATERHDA